MKAIWMIIVMVVSLWLTADAATPNKRVGLTADATGQPLPLMLTVTELCVGSCALLSAPDYANPLRFWGMDAFGNCRRSDDGGFTWNNCPSNPSGTSMYHYAGTGDGGVVAAGQIGGSCTVMRSSDGGNIWTTVFSAVVTDCGGANSTTRMKCSSSGVCEFVFTPFLGIPKHLTSSSHGTGFVQNDIGTQTIGYILSNFAFNGTLGFSTPTSLGATNRALFLNTGTFAQGAAWAAGTDCGGPFVASGLGLSPVAAVCRKSPTNTFDIRDTDGAVIKSFTLPGGVTSVTGSPELLVGEGNAVYMAALDRSDLLSLWVSADSGSTWFKIYTGTVTQTNRQGDIFIAGGCVYFSGGNIATTFVKSCR